MNNIILKEIRNGNEIIELTDIDSIENELNLKKGDTHLCWDCKNGHPDKCSKIADLQKGSIESYEFIKDGFQLVQDGIVDKFIITRCQNFECCDNNKTAMTPEFIDATNSLMLYYYDVESVEEAIETRESLRRRGYHVKKVRQHKVY